MKTKQEKKQSSSVFVKNSKASGVKVKNVKVNLGRGSNKNIATETIKMSNKRIEQKPKNKNVVQSQKEKDHHSDQMNKNKKSSGVNITNSKVHGNRSKQLQANRKANSDK